ncbi:MAG: hypothetical protein ACT4QC_24205 [Planctomycetaceae bacterium]
MPESEPFPHIFVEEFFPPTIYHEMLSRLPAETHYEPFQYEKHATRDGKISRTHFPLTSRAIDRLDPRDGLVWYAIRDVLRSQEIKQATFTRLAGGLVFRYGVRPGQVLDLPAFAYPELFRETGGYCIKPHPDTRRKVVTMQIALPADDARPGLGTQFYRRSYNPLTLLREPRGFEIARRAPFLPNFAYAFVVLNTLALKSWHGRTTLAAGSTPRNTILNIWYERADEAGTDYIDEQRATAIATPRRAAA